MAAAHVHTVKLPIDGMSCASCVARLERALQEVPLVQQATVHLITASATVTVTGAITTELVQELADAVVDAGYRLGAVTHVLQIANMTCASCVSRIETTLKAVPGVRDVTANFATGQTTVRANFEVNVDQLKDALRANGYRTLVSSYAKTELLEQATELSQLRRDTWLAAVLAAPVFLVEMGSHFSPALHQLIRRTVEPALLYQFEFVLTSLVLLFPGRRFFSSGIPALLRLRPDMNSLVAVGTAAAYLFSVISTFLPDALPLGSASVYYEAAAVIVVLILFGRLLETRAKRRSGEAISRLLKLSPKTALVRHGDTFVETDVNQVQVGHELRIRPGEQVPVDGIVGLGESYVNEAMITGEATPVAKRVGAAVIGGTLNQTGTLEIRATAVGAKSTLSRIIELVEHAQNSKLPIQARVDRVAQWFIPLVFAAAVVTFSTWLLLGQAPALPHALVNAVAVLIVACPCAMGLAVPTSILVGSGRGAELGVLFRNGEALQRLAEAKVVAFDKTGTLTLGKPQLTDVAVVNGFRRDQVLSRVAAIEALSEHPVASAIAEAAQNERFAPASVEGFQSVTGRGVSASVEGVQVDVGSEAYLRGLGLDVSALQAAANARAEEGKTTIFVGFDKTLAALLAVSDPLKETTREALHKLQALGKQLTMLSGDNVRTARTVARKLGLTDFVAEITPSGKVDALKRLRQQYGPVAFVGDGINDAPALTEADVGLGVGTGTDIAIESADVVLMNGDLTAVSTALELSTATLRNIRQNLFWAFFYNALLIPVAAGCLYPAFGLLLSPMLASSAMAVSSVFVVVNALRLRSFGRSDNNPKAGFSSTSNTPTNDSLRARDRA